MQGNINRFFASDSSRTQGARTVGPVGVVCHARLVRALWKRNGQEWTAAQPNMWDNALSVSSVPGGWHRSCITRIAGRTGVCRKSHSKQCRPFSLPRKI